MDSTALVGAVLTTVWVVGRVFRAAVEGDRWRSTLTVGLVFVAVTLTCLTGGGWSTYVKTRGWIPTSATVLDSEPRTTWPRIYRHFLASGEDRVVATSTVEVSYLVDGQEKTWTGTLDEVHHQDQTIQVRYDPDNPTDIVEVTATSEMITPVWGSTNNTVASIGGMSVFALAAVGSWIVTIPVVTVASVSWRVSRRRQAVAEVQEDTTQEDLEQSPGPHQPGPPGQYQP